MNDYIIIRTFSASDLMEKVNAEIKNGYMPIGGVFVVDSIPLNTFYQALIKNTK